VSKKRATKQDKEAGSKKHVGKVTQPLKFTAIPVTQTKHTLYLFTAKASTLFRSLSINRRIEDKDEGYQRVLSPSRVNAIARYVLAKRTIPGAIIVSLDEGATFSKAKSELTIPAGTDVGWVIDGQHRLAGAHVASQGEDGVNVDLPVVAFIGLSEVAHIELFVTINREAKNVPTSLYLDLLRHLPNKKPAEIAKERAADIATELRKDEESPFFERIAVTGPPKPGQISLTNFVRKIAPLVAPDRGLLNPYTEREQLLAISNYFDGLRQVFAKEYESKDSIFFKTVGFGALWNAFPVFFGLALKYQHAFAVKDVAAVFRRVSIDFSTFPQYGSGDQAERNAAEDVKTALYAAYKQGGEEEPSALKLF
jgi:DGQHR domain-containing protein